MRITLTDIPTLIPSISHKNRVDKRRVTDFKKKWCNENEIIAAFVKNQINKYFISPVLDVGAGLGDIAYNALSNKEVICIDINKITLSDYPVAEKHKRLQKDFLKYLPDRKIETIFISHALQYLDDDIKMLNDKVNEINPQNIILVRNDNNDFMGELVQWSFDNCADTNPEIYIPEFPYNYKLIDKKYFQATISCESFENLSKQVCYLMLTDLKITLRKKLIALLKQNLKKPILSFTQVIEIYVKNDQ